MHATAIRRPRDFLASNASRTKVARSHEIAHRSNRSRSAVASQLLPLHSCILKISEHFYITLDAFLYSIVDGEESERRLAVHGFLIFAVNSNHSFIVLFFRDHVTTDHHQHCRQTDVFSALGVPLPEALLTPIYIYKAQCSESTIVDRI